jgi:hypothetical protein
MWNSLVYGFQHAGDEEVVFEFDNYGLVCESFEDRENQLPAKLRIDEWLWGRWQVRTIVAGAGEGMSLISITPTGLLQTTTISPERILLVFSSRLYRKDLSPHLLDGSSVKNKFPSNNSQLF